MSDAYDQLDVTSAAELRRWLKDHHNSSPGIWLVTHKKGAGEKYLAYEDIVCEALCYGWIDSKVRTLDGLRSQPLLTPRKPRCSWSRPNKERVARPEAGRPDGGPRPGDGRAGQGLGHLDRPGRRGEPSSRLNWPRPSTPTRRPATTGTPSRGQLGGPPWSGSATRRLATRDKRIAGIELAPNLRAQQQALAVVRVTSIRAAGSCSDYTCWL